MRGALTLAALLLTGLLAGCAAPAGGGLEAYDVAADAADEWASDAVLVGLMGLEVAENATFPGEGAGTFAGMATFDAEVGDGAAPYWMALFYSESLGSTAAIAVLDGKAQAPIEAPVEQSDIEEHGIPSATPDIDSTDVVEALAAHDAAIADLFSSGMLEHVMYAFDAEDDAWAVHAMASDGRELSGVVADETRAVTAALVDTAKPIVTDLAPIYDNVTVMATADPLNVVGMPPCSTPTSGCVEYPFTLDRKAKIDASLTWSLEANDFDFYVYQGDQQVLSGASDISAGPGNSEHVVDTLPAGDYTLVVVPWAVAEDEYQLAVTFA